MELVVVAREIGSGGQESHFDVNGKVIIMTHTGLVLFGLLFVVVDFVVVVCLFVCFNEQSVFGVTHHCTISMSSPYVSSQGCAVLVLCEASVCTDTHNAFMAAP